MTGSQVHLFVAGLFGALGVALWAYAGHGGLETGVTAAQLLLIHAGAIVALTNARRSGLLPERAAMFAISALALGVILFCGDLSLRALAGQRLFPLAAPIGGMAMIGAWLVLGVMGLMRRRA